MLLWHGQAGSPDAQYGNMEVDGLGYAPCVTSAQELAASGWNRAHEVVTGRDIARALYPDRWGIWLNPHAPGGGVGIPWLDLRRIATGLDRMPAGPLRLSEPAIEIPQFYALLTQNAHRTPAVRSLRRAWVQPALGAPYLAIGLDLYDTSRPSVDVGAGDDAAVDRRGPGRAAGLHGRDVRRVRPGRDVAARQRPPVLRPRGPRAGAPPRRRPRLRVPGYRRPRRRVPSRRAGDAVRTRRRGRRRAELVSPAYGALN